MSDSALLRPVVSQETNAVSRNLKKIERAYDRCVLEGPVSKVVSLSPSPRTAGVA